MTHRREAYLVLAALTAWTGLEGCADARFQPELDQRVLLEHRGQSPGPVEPDLAAADLRAAPDAGTAASEPPCETRCSVQAAHLCVTDPAAGLCVECLSDGDCQANPGAAGPTCDTTRGYCMCWDDADCAGKQLGGACNRQENICGCRDDYDCPSGLECIGRLSYTKVCKAPCKAHAHCAGNMFDTVCDLEHGCVECVSSADCYGSEALGPACVGGYCLCSSDLECAGNLNGTRCLNHVCSCEDAGDCLPGRACAGEYLGDKLCI